MHTPLHEFDPSPSAVINPSIHRAPLGFPDRAVCCWFGNVVRDRTAGVAAIPVSAFYDQPRESGVVRFCFAKKEQTLANALERLARL